MLKLMLKGLCKVVKKFIIANIVSFMENNSMLTNTQPNVRNLGPYLSEDANLVSCEDIGEVIGQYRI